MTGWESLHNFTQGEPIHKCCKIQWEDERGDDLWALPEEWKYKPWEKNRGSKTKLYDTVNETQRESEGKLTTEFEVKSYKFQPNEKTVTPQIIILTITHVIVKGQLTLVN